MTQAHTTSPADRKSTAVIGAVGMVAALLMIIAGVIIVAQALLLGGSMQFVLSGAGIVAGGIGGFAWFRHRRLAALAGGERP